MKLFGDVSDSIKRKLDSEKTNLKNEMENEKWRKSKEVVRLRFSGWDSSTLLRSSFKDGEITLEVLI